MRKSKRSAPVDPNEDIAVDPRITRLIRAIATAVGNDKIPEEVAVRTMALTMALIRAMEDGTFHEISEKAGKVYAMAEIYHRYLKGEIGDEELIAHLGSIQLSVLARTPPPPSSPSQPANSNEKQPNQTGEDGVFARLFASLMFSTTTSKHESY
jgi:hypothetical protein